GKFPMKEFQRDVAPKREVFSKVDNAHPAGPKQRFDSYEPRVRPINDPESETAAGELRKLPARSYAWIRSSTSFFSNGSSARNLSRNNARSSGVCSIRSLKILSIWRQRSPFISMFRVRSVAILACRNIHGGRRNNSAKPAECRSLFELVCDPDSK